MPKGRNIKGAGSLNICPSVKKEGPRSSNNTAIVMFRIWETQINLFLKLFKPFNSSISTNKPSSHYGKVVPTWCEDEVLHRTFLLQKCNRC